jgi:hypothetical protein
LTPEKLEALARDYEARAAHAEDIGDKASVLPLKTVAVVLFELALLETEEREAA